jgi:cytochrome c biogenesis protein CcmG/thiol:disulfide interchange protein DsbE
MANRTRQKSKIKKSPFPLILVGVGLIIIVFVVLVLTPRDKPPSKGGTRVGSAPREVDFPAPELVLVNLDGVPVSLSELRGQVILVNNWATWCPPCRAEMPELQAYFQAHAADGFILVGINSGDRQDQVVDFVRQYGLTFPIWVDPTGLALHAFQNNALPSSYVIDKSGTVRLVWVGGVSLEALEAYLTPMLAD